MFYTMLHFFSLASLATNNSFFTAAVAEEFADQNPYDPQIYECTLTPCPDVLVIYDISGTVKANAKERLESSKNYLHEAVEESNNSFAIISFATKPSIYLPFTSDKSAIHDSINAIKPYKIGDKRAWTNMDSGIRTALNLIQTTNNTNKLITLLFSDFRPDSPRSAQHEIESALKLGEHLRNNTLRLYTIAYPGSIRKGVLRQMAGEPPNRSYTHAEFIKDPPTLCHTL